MTPSTDSMPLNSAISLSLSFHLFLSLSLLSLPSLSDLWREGRRGYFEGNSLYQSVCSLTVFVYPGPCLEQQHQQVNTETWQRTAEAQRRGGRRGEGDEGGMERGWDGM